MISGETVTTRLGMAACYATRITSGKFCDVAGCGSARNSADLGSVEGNVDDQPVRPVAGAIERSTDARA